MIADGSRLGWFPPTCDRAALRKLVGGIMVTFPVACRRYRSLYSSVWDDGTGTLPAHTVSANA